MNLDNKNIVINDGNIYVVIEEDDDSGFPVCPQCGKRHPKNFPDLLKIMLFGGRGEA